LDRVIVRISRSSQSPIQLTPSARYFEKRFGSRSAPVNGRSQTLPFHE
jgi:hypothetical protein